MLATSIVLYVIYFDSEYIFEGRCLSRWWVDEWVAAQEYEHVAGIRTQEASDPGIRQAFSNLKANGQQERS